MNKTSLNKKEILASSSGWLAALLNLFPGLGVGYIYQRRWIPYLLTGGAIVLWFGIGVVLQTDSEPTSTEQIIGLSGLLLISIVSGVESYLTHKKSLKMVAENKLQEKKIEAKKGWF
tara:strand:- start:234 stop:584 length:351 start_codon:yes stop_codon:yes gene_type:complete